MLRLAVLVMGLRGQNLLTVSIKRKQLFLGELCKEEMQVLIMVIPGGNKLQDIGVFASHGGTNIQAIIDACRDGRLNAMVSVVISNNSDSFALKRSKQEGIPSFHISTAKYPNPIYLENNLVEILEEYHVDVIVLAGYMKKLGEKILKKYSGRILNIHPSLLPKYGGQGMYGNHVHEAVIKQKKPLLVLQFIW
jgi:folate-dependent phosphoribosylglycinamide formyltransferase PurN